MSFQYEANGNQTTRNVGSSYSLAYDAENRLTGVTGGTSAAFLYDGDGNRVKSTEGITTTIYIGNYFEWSGSTTTMKKYYYAGSTRVAMRTGTGSGATALSLLLGDQLGSTSVTYRVDTQVIVRQYYKPWGEIRPGPNNSLPTDYTYTGQKWDSSLKLMFYGSRWYDGAVGRFVQPDSMIPDQNDPQSWDRFAYAVNNPVRYNDPSGHCIFGIDTLVCLAVAGAAIGAGVGYASQVINNYQNGVKGSEAWTTNIKQDPIVAGGLLGGAALPLVTTVAGIGIAAAGEALGGLATSRLQSMTNAANSELGADPSIALRQNILSQAEYAASQSSSRAATMQYGNAVERMVDNAIEGSKIDSMFFKVVGGPSNPDFVGRGILRGMNFDITTPGQVASHLLRPLYGPGLNVVTYTRPPTFMVFP